MASFNGNAAYLTVGGTDVSTYWADITLTGSQNSQDITAGASTTHVELAAGLNNYSISMTLSYDDTDIATYIANLAPGIVTIDWGPEGSGSGNPRHTQSFHLGSNAVNQAVTKDHVTFSISANGASAPSNDLFAGATF